MYKIIFTRASRDIIRNFITSYKENFLKTFTDTGIYYENLIRKNYIDNSKKFYNEIRTSIIKLLELEKVLGYKISDSGFHQIVTLIGNYRIFIEYSENIGNKTRFIEKISFHKK